MTATRGTAAREAGRVTRAAAVDIGSTSVHLLVGEVAEGGLTSLLDLSELLGLGARIEAEGLLGPVVRAELAEIMSTYADEARRLAPDVVVFVSTDPLRHAADAARAAHEIERAAGIPVHVLDQAEEGALTLLGVAGSGPHGDLSVVDIGGGSTEIVLAGPGGIREVVGLPLGASRLSAVVDPDDPPTVAQVAALRDEVDRILAVAPDLELGEVVWVGGTAYGVARVATGPGYGERLVDRQGIDLAVAVAGREPSARVAEEFGLNPRRARILPAGVAILDGIVRRYGLERIRISEYGIREGLVLAMARDGLAWRDRLAATAHPRQAG